MEEPKIQISLDLSIASQPVIEVLLEDTSDPGIFDEIAKANQNRPEILKLLLEHPDTSEDLKKSISGALYLPAKVPAEIVRTEKKPERRFENMLQKIQKLKVSEKIQLALRGGREIRTILIKDTNKEVMMCVLENQKITESEIEMIARSRSVPDETLRKISKNREWMKKYAIILALVTNPKTPPGISITFVSNLKIRDLTILEKNKNVSEVVRQTSQKLLKSRRPS